MQKYCDVYMIMPKEFMSTISLQKRHFFNLFKIILKK